MRVIIYCFLLLLMACNVRTPADTIKDKFDSVNRSLEQTKNIVDASTDLIYDSLQRKSGDTAIKRLRFSINDFYYYINSLESSFKKVSGDKSGEELPEDSWHKLELTNKFFIEEKNAEELFNKIEKLKLACYYHTRDSAIISDIGKLGAGDSSPENFVKRYFNNVPPVAAVTVLNKFENDVKKLENRILSSYLIWKVGDIKIDILENTKAR